MCQICILRRRAAAEPEHIGHSRIVLPECADDVAKPHLLTVVERERGRTVLCRSVAHTTISILLGSRSLPILGCA